MGGRFENQLFLRNLRFDNERATAGLSTRLLYNLLGTNVPTLTGLMVVFRACTALWRTIMAELWGDQGIKESSPVSIPEKHCH